MAPVFEAADTDDTEALAEWCARPISPTFLPAAVLDLN
jgi:hypothetical protein